MKKVAGALAWALVFGLVFQVSLLIAFAGATTGYLPAKGDYFTYTDKIGLRDGTGYYDGWSEETDSSGQYNVLTTNATEATINVQYTWSYSDSNYGSDSGSGDRTVPFFLLTRLYDSVQTDVDSYDNIADGHSLAVWFWIPPSVAVGVTVQIMDAFYRVTDLHAQFMQNGIPRFGIELQGNGPATLSYDGQNWTGTYTDTMYFDPTTGYVLSEQYVAQQTGNIYEEPTTFTWYEEYDTTSASFALPVNVALLAGIILGIIALIVGILLVIVALAYAVHWRVVVESFPSYDGPIRIYRVRRYEDFPQLENQATLNFENFLEDFANKTLLQGGRIAVATWTNIRKNPPKEALIGVAYYTKEEDIGVIFCKNTNVTERLRRYIRCKDFFSELRHQVSQADLQEMQSDFGRQVQPQAYNIFETYQLLELQVIEPTGYDTSSITLMREADLPVVIDVAQKVYQVPCKKSITAQFASGDIGFVARVKNRIVGFAFVTPNSQQGRNHTLTVLPEFRNHGIGTELLRARLAALAQLGIPSVITEIADWNLPSLQVSNKFGFHKIGEMFVETARQQRIKKNIVRW